MSNVLLIMGVIFVVSLYLISCADKAWKDPKLREKAFDNVNKFNEVKTDECNQ